GRRAVEGEVVPNARLRRGGRVMSLGNGQVASRLPGVAANLAWRLATHGLKASGCQARRSLHAWQVTQCQAVAKRGASSGDANRGIHKTSRRVFEFAVDDRRTRPARLETRRYRRGKLESQFDGFVAFEMHRKTNRLPVCVVTADGGRSGRQAVIRMPEANANILENVSRPRQVLNGKPNAHVDRID